MFFSPILIPVNRLDGSFQREIYAATRAAEMTLVTWSDEQKEAFLQMQFEAQNQHYLERYPNASFNLIKVNGATLGRLYLAELLDEIRIIDLTFLPQHFDKIIFLQLIEEILQRGKTIEKPVSIYLESFNPEAEIFSDLGFHKIDTHGIYFLWQYKTADAKTNVNSRAINA